MSDKKLYKKLPVVHQTTAIKNFFESTVEQLFSKSNTESIQGYIGSRSSDDINLSGQYLQEPTVTKRFYGLSPTVNTINPDTGDSENLIFYDELVDTLKTYGVDVSDHNKLFGDRYSAFLPPIDPDKLLNYSEYYWYPEGPSTINVRGTATNPIDIHTDVIGKAHFTPPSGKPFRNGMIVRFDGEYVTPQTLTISEYIVTGVGENIQLVNKKDNFSTRFTDVKEAEFDYFTNDLSEAVHSAAYVQELHITSHGRGYVDPEILIYDNVYVYEDDTGSDYANLALAYPEGRIEYTNEFEQTTNVISLAKTIESNLGEQSLTDYSNIVTIINAFGRTYIDSSGTEQPATLAQANITLNTFNGIEATVSGGAGYTGETDILVFDTIVQATANVTEMVAQHGNAIVTDTILVDTTTNIKVGQSVTGYDFTSTVKQVIPVDVPAGIAAQVVLNDNIDFNSTLFAANPTLTFKGVDFSAVARMSNAVYGDGTVNLQSTQAKVGVNPNNPKDYYFVGGTRSYDVDLDGDGTGDGFWGGTVANSSADYIIQQRGAKNKNVWSRVNFWYHRDNFLDAGDSLPNREYRAERPIIEFDRNLELYNHADTTAGTVTMAVTGALIADIEGQKPGFTLDSVPLENSTFIVTNESKDANKYIYTAKLNINTGVLEVIRAGDPLLNPANTVDGDSGFIPFEIKKNQSVQILSGGENIGKEFVYNGVEWMIGQEKVKANQAPLFKLYDDSGVLLDDDTKYPSSTFKGNKIFGYARSATSDSILSTVKDKVLGFPLVYQQYKSSSEIVFENFQDTTTYKFTPLNASSASVINGYRYYKNLSDNKFYSAWKNATDVNEQRVYTTYTLTQVDIDRSLTRYSIGCVPRRNTNKNSGYDIEVKINGNNFENFVYSNTLEGYIELTGGSISAGDFIEISAGTDTGLLRINSNSKYELPLSWGHNYTKQDIRQISEPEYLEHFSKYMSNQDGFAGEPLGSNNFSNGPKNVNKARTIVQTNHDLVLGAFLVDDQPHNLVDALRFCGHEYVKYKHRLRNEIQKLYESDYGEGPSVEQMLETTLRNLISFKIGTDVFNRTYIVPFGDNFLEETFVAALNQTQFVLKNSADLDKIENSLLIYLNDNLLCIDKDYEISSFSPISINILSNANLKAGDKIVAKLYDAERDSAQCPPTPSTMGLLPLHQPEKVLDSTFQTPIEVIIGHDGSKTPAYGDYRDDVLMNFETRIYNSAKGEFRERNSILDYSTVDVRGGAFRDNNYKYTEWQDLLRHGFSVWTNINPVNPIINEFYDEDNEWTWNYGDDSFPGHWRGIYEFYYDTDRPNSHPWEMLGFTEKPLWWDEQYGSDYSVTNVAMWDDLEEGIIRRGPRENLQNENYLYNNPFRRKGLKAIIPVDANGNLISPYRLFTTGTTRKTVEWVNTDTGNHSGFKTSSFLNVDGLNVSYDSSNVYVQSSAIVNHSLPIDQNVLTQYTTLYGEPLKEQPISYVIGTTPLNTVLSNPTPMAKNGAVAVAVNGLPLYGVDYGNSWQNEGVWYEDRVRRERRRDLNYESDNKGLFHYHVLIPEIVGLQEWSTTEHSPIVAWAFDGLPVYGPYGYSDPTDNTSEIVRIKSPWVLREGLRTSGPGGAHTGVYIQDYRLDATLEAASGYTNRFNVRYSVTPDSPTSPIWHYVCTLDENLQPAFPYHVGGGIENVDHWAGNYYASSTALGRIGNIEVLDEGGLYTTANITISGDGFGATANAVIEDGKITSVVITNPGSNYTQATVAISGDGVRAKLKINLSDVDNARNSATVNSEATPAYTSTKEVELRIIGDISKEWKFGDTSPVEYAWKKSENFGFVQSEALLLAKPGRFASVFSDPTNLYKPVVGGYLMSNVDKKRWKFTNKNHFRIHGDRDSDGKFITNVGYTQFINSWLKFQGLNIDTDFAPQLRTLNMKLAHRMNGYVDKDTMIVRTDQYSNDGKATSLIIPNNNVDVTVHSSNYKDRHFYTGVLIEKTATGYRLRGYDRTKNYFEILESKVVGGRRQSVEVGGEGVDFIQWRPNETYTKGTIVKYRDGFYQSEANLTVGDTFDPTGWANLPSLPQQNGAKGVLYQETTGKILRVNYNTVYETVQEVYDFLISLGRHQESHGYDFGEYDPVIGEVRNWQYAAKQFLFWTVGKWEIGNTILLSPLANKANFEVPRGFIAKINRSEREQFSILDQDGGVIPPEECEIIRENNKIEIKPPTGSQIYAVMLFTKEVEHALILDNKTDFNDVIYDDLLYQKHSRIKVKATRTKNWTGKLFTEGFLVNDDELLPNLDNLAETMGRYTELGFIPVEKQIYDISRQQYGFNQRDYLRDLDVADEEQFDFYRGMIQSKGTAESLTRIARSSAVVQGNVTVYDEWALKAGEFGDLDNSQSVELKLTKSEIVQEPQLITTRTPVDITYSVTGVEVLQARYTYDTPPQIVISSPADKTGVQAEAKANLNSEGKIESVTVTNAGNGYRLNEACAMVIGAEVQSNNTDTLLNNAVADIDTSNSFIDTNKTNVTVTLADNISGSGNITLLVDTAPANITVADIVDAINSNASLNVNITAKEISSHQGSTVGSHIILSGKDFTVVDGANISLVNGTYQPKQRFPLVTTVYTNDYNTSVEDVKVYIDGVSIPNQATIDNVTTTNWVYVPGNVNTITTSVNHPTIDTNSPRGNADQFDLINNSVTFNLSSPLDANNINLSKDGVYEFVEVYINGTRVKNLTDSERLPVVATYANLPPLASALGQAYVVRDELKIYLAQELTNNNTWTHVGTVLASDIQAETSQHITFKWNSTRFILTQNTITFPDVKNLPQELLTAFKNPPENYSLSGQRETVYALPAGSKIEVIERGAIEFDDSLKKDLPGSTVKGVVLVQEGLSVKIAPQRTFEITPDLKSDRVITIDIDDKNRFVKKPTGQIGYSIWPVTGKVDHTGITDKDYPTIPNAGYVHPEDVKYRAFDLASLPDLFDENVLLKPQQGDLIHVAKSENNDWNVYRLENTAAQTEFLMREEGGNVSLYTDYSLFNYLDTNQIGEPNTGRYLDYFLTLNNATLSDKVVVWNNESVIQSKQTTITAFDAPQMVEARIASIRPRNLRTISNVEPETGRYYNGLQITNVNDTTNQITIAGNNFSEIEVGDYIRLLDNAGVVSQYDANMTASGNVLTINARGIANVEITNGGQGYQSVPIVTFSSPSNGGNLDVAAGTAYILGNVASISITDTGNVQTPAPEITIQAPDSGNTATATGEITGAEIVGFEIINPGSDYAKDNQNIAVTITGANTTLAVAHGHTDSEGRIDYIDIEDRGAGYSELDIQVTVGSSGNPAVVRPILRGNLSVTMTSVGDGYDFVPEVTIDNGEVTGATAILNAEVTHIGLIRKGAGYATTDTVTMTLDAANTSPATATINMQSGVDEVAARFAQVGAGNVSIKLSAQYQTDFLYLNNVDLTAEQKATAANITALFGRAQKVQSVDAVSGNITIVNDAVTDVTVLGNNIIRSNVYGTGYSINVYETFDNQDYEVLTRTPTTITINRPNSVKSYAVSMRHYNQSKITSANHGYQEGDVVRIRTNKISGMFKIEHATQNKFTIPAKYVPGFTDGEIISEGLEIKTVGNHGISPLYAASGKRIAVHFAEPLYYNKVYPISSLTADKLFVDDYWPRDARTHVYYEHKQKLLNGSSPYQEGVVSLANATNTIAVTENIRMADHLIQYTSNSDVVSSAHLTWHGNYLEVSPTALPGNTSISTEVSVQRQMYRGGNRYAMLTTIDHDKVTLNGSTVSVPSYNNPQAVASSLNREMEKRRQFTNTDNGNFGLRFAMLKNPNTAIYEDFSAGEISDYGPYIRDKNMIELLSGGKLSATGEMSIGNTDEERIDPNFSKANKQVGPHKGLTYTDENTGVEYCWSPALQRYKVKYIPPDVGDVDEREDDRAEDHEYQTRNKEYEYKEGDQSNTTIVDPDILTSIPGSREGVIIGAPGYTQPVYDMQANVSYTVNSNVSVIPKYRLAPNNYNVYEVYEGVQNDDEDLYYILVDKVPPPLVEHDFYATVSFWSDFNTLPLTNYYYDNEIIPTVNVSNQITNADDPIRLQNTGYVLSLGEVEPAAYIGLQKVTEPFAVSGGNGTDAQQNILAAAQMRVSSPDLNTGATIEVETNGYDSFLLWTGGLKPATRIPDAAGPGRLPGYDGTPSTLGFGRGYYQPGVNDFPADYPETATLTYDRPIQRLAYSRNVPVYPESRNYVFDMWEHFGNVVANIDVVSGESNVTITDDTVANVQVDDWVIISGTEIGTITEVNGNVITLSQPLTADLARNESFAVEGDGTRFTQEQYQDAVDNGLTSIGAYPLDELILRTINPEFGVQGAGDGKLVAENIFVACFWTEDFTYVDQIVGWDYNNLYADGTPKEITEDYDGTVVRFKYIRLTELPETAVTRRLIPDTGYAGKGWTNRQVDTVTLDFTDANEDEIWELFNPDNYTAGSTGGEGGPRTVNVGDRGNTTQPTDAGTTVTNDGTLIVDDPFKNDDLVPTTPVGPILTGSIFDGLPGPCVPPDDPSKNTVPNVNGDIACGEVDVVTKYVQLSAAQINDENTGRVILGPDESWGYHSFKVFGEGDVSLFFNTVQHIPGVATSEYTQSDTPLGFVLVQHQDQYPADGTDEDKAAWVSDIRNILFSTEHSGSNDSNDGDQIIYYGFENFDQRTEESRDLFVEDQLGLAVDHPWFTHTPIPGDGSQYWNGSHLPSGAYFSDEVPLKDILKTGGGAKQNVIVEGIGALTKYGVDCSQGQWLTLFIMTQCTDTSGGVRGPADGETIKGDPDKVWSAVIKYQTEKIILDNTDDPEDGTDDNGEVVCAYENASSRAYQQGMFITEYQASSDNGYFGQHDDNGEYDKGTGRNNLDNIYFDHSPPSTVLSWHPDTPYKSGTPKEVTGNFSPYSKQATYTSKIKSGWYSSFSSWNFNYDAYNRERRTLVGKGYWLCPSDGLYEVSGYSDDGLHVWISSAWGGFQNHPYGGKYAHRIGVNDLGEITKWGTTAGPITYEDGQEVGEYFTEDKPLDKNTLTSESATGGYNWKTYAKGGNHRYNGKPGYGTWTTYEANNSYMDSKFYHHENSVLRTGWLTTDHESSSSNQTGIDYPNRCRANPFSCRVLTELKGGEYYLVRVIAGNNRGPGYGRFTWRNITNGTQGAMTFGGRYCPDDNPSEVDETQTGNGAETTTDTSLTVDPGWRFVAEREGDVTWTYSVTYGTTLIESGQRTQKPYVLGQTGPGTGARRVYSFSLNTNTVQAGLLGSVKGADDKETSGDPDDGGDDNTASAQDKAYQKCIADNGANDAKQKANDAMAGIAVDWTEDDIPGLVCYYKSYGRHARDVTGSLAEQVEEAAAADTAPPAEAGTILEEGCATTMSFDKDPETGENLYYYTGKYYYKVADGEGGYTRQEEDSGDRCPPKDTIVGSQDEEDWFNGGGTPDNDDSDEGDTQIDGADDGTDDDGGDSGDDGTVNDTDDGTGTGSGTGSGYPAAGTVLAQICETKVINVLGTNFVINTGMLIQQVADGNGGSSEIKVVNLGECPIGTTGFA